MKNLDLDNNWVVIDPTVDTYKIANSISGKEPLSKSQINIENERKPKVEHNNPPEKKNEKAEPSEDDEENVKNNSCPLANNNNTSNNNNYNYNDDHDDSFPTQFLDEQQENERFVIPFFFVRFC